MSLLDQAEIVDDRDVEEAIHLERVVPLRRQWLRLLGPGAAPPLAIERTVPREGPSRPPVILVHGFAQNRYTWRVSGRSFVGALAEAGHDVLNLELRGHGNSRAYGASNASAFSDYVADVARVARACPTPPFAVGHSLGAGAIVGAATEVPLRGIVHLAGVFSFAQGNATLRALARASLALSPLLTLGPVRLSTGWAGTLLAELYSLTDIAGYALPLAGWVPGSIERHLLEERLVRGFDWTSVEVWLQMSRWATGAPFEYAEAFRALDVPLLVMCGDADPLMPPVDARACFEGAGCADRTFLVMEPWEHQVHWGHLDLLLGRKAPEETWPRILAWLRER